MIEGSWKGMKKYLEQEMLFDFASSAVQTAGMKGALRMKRLTAIYLIILFLLPLHGLADQVQSINEPWFSARGENGLYGFIDRDGNKHDEEGDEAFPYGSNRIQVEALDIQTALDEAKKQLLAMAGNRDWQEVRIYDVGICNDNIW